MNEQPIDENMDLNAPPAEPVDFDEANRAAYDMLNNTQNEPPETEPVSAEEQTPDNPPQAAEPPLTPEQQQAAQPPEQPTQEMILQRAFGEMQKLQAENQRLQQAISQMSEAQKTNVVDEALQMPVIDFNSMAFDDEATLGRKQADYTQKMAEYMKASMMKELSPFIEQAREGIEQKQKSEVLSALAAIPEFQGISEMIPQLDNIISKNRIFSAPDIPLDEKYITAYLLANGIKSKSAPQQDAMTPEKFMRLYNSNQELRDLVDKQRLAEIKGTQEIPLMSASNGAVNAALNIPKTPTNIGEAFELSKKYLG